MVRLKLQRLLLSVLLLSGTVMAAPTPTRVAWMQGEEWVALERTATGAAVISGVPKTPLGSVWKLFVYAYIEGRALPERPYRCAPSRQVQSEEDYCCDPGDSVTREQALVRSCGPYFSSQRLAISPRDWADFWRAQNAPDWLLDIGVMQPGTEVAVPELLRGLRQVPDLVRVAARQVLLPLTLRDDLVLASLGAAPRFKTWSWHVNGQAAGGAAGWLADGTPFWFGAASTSRNALHSQSPWLAWQWQRHGLDARRLDAAVSSAQPCVDVDFFQRYMVRAVHRPDGQDAVPGAMSGRYRIIFENGRELAITPGTGMYLGRSNGVLSIRARFPLEEYVARVVDREGLAQETHAARALAVAARTYVLQNATQAEGCRRIADDSRAQRVSPNAPSEAARAAAVFTEGLVISGKPIRYHQDQAGPNVMSWQAAVDAGRNGQSFVTILRDAYPGTALSLAQNSLECELLPQAQRWLIDRQHRWREMLRAQVGYQELGNSLRVCQLAMGTPHSDQRRLEIRVREWLSREGRVTLIHEYLHLAFRHHPNGQNEMFIEQLAQRLADT